MRIPIARATIQRGLGVLVTIVCLSLLVVSAADKNAGAKKKEKAAVQHTPPNEDIFKQHRIFRIQIEIPEQGLETLRTFRWQGRAGGNEKRPSVKAIVREGGKEFRDVAVHLKGAAGSFRSVDNNPSFTLNF